MAEINKWRLAVMIAGGIILGVFLVDHFINSAAHASVSYVSLLAAGATCQQDLESFKANYYDCMDARYNDLTDQQAATDFLVKNHAGLQFPSCFKDLSYMTTGSKNILYVSKGNYMGWAPENLTPYCWNNETYFFGCEDLCLDIDKLTLD